MPLPAHKRVRVSPVPLAAQKEEKGNPVPLAAQTLILRKAEPAVPVRAQHSAGYNASISSPRPPSNVSKEGLKLGRDPDSAVRVPPQLEG